MNIQLTISLLVSDRQETLGRCLASLKPLLSELDSELIVVYTGKNPETLELAEQYASLVIPFTWCSDFAKARNAGLSQAKGEWFLYLDDDEWFGDITEILQFFKSGEYRNYQTAYYIQRNYTDWEGNSCIDCFVPRMCRLRPEIHFSAPIHEYLSPFPTPSKNLHSFVHHFGYIGEKEKGRRDLKADRNIPLLLKRLESEQEKEAAHCCMQLAQEYRKIREFGTAAEYCKKGLELAGRDATVYAPEMWMQVNYPMLLSLDGKSQKALDEAEKLLVHPRTFNVAAASLCTILVNLCHDQKDFQKAAHYVCLYRQKMEHLRKHPEEAEMQKCSEITLDFAEGKAVPTYVYGLISTSETSDFSLMKKILTWIPWNDRPHVSCYYALMEEWKNLYPAQEGPILEGYSALNTEDPYVNLQKAYYAEQQGQAFQTEFFWKLCVMDCPEWLLWQPVQMAVRSRFSLTPLMERISLDIWVECARSLTEHIPVTDLQSFFNDIQSLLESYPLCMASLDQHFLEKQLSQGLMEHSRLICLLRRYCESSAFSAENLYRSEVIAACRDGGSDDAECKSKGEAASGYLLPSQYRFAFKMKRFLDLLDEGKYAECIPVLRTAYRIYPKMMVLAGQLTQYLSEQIQNPPQAVPEEFTRLGGQVKQVLAGLIEKEQWEEAYNIAAQLMALLPNDLEVLRMKQMLLRQRT